MSASAADARCSSETIVSGDGDYRDRRRQRADMDANSGYSISPRDPKPVATAPTAVGQVPTANGNTATVQRGFVRENHRACGADGSRRGRVRKTASRSERERPRRIEKARELGFLNAAEGTRTPTRYPGSPQHGDSGVYPSMRPETSRSSAHMDGMDEMDDLDVAADVATRSGRCHDRRNGRRRGADEAGVYAVKHSGLHVGGAVTQLRARDETPYRSRFACIAKRSACRRGSRSR